MAQGCWWDHENDFARPCGGHLASFTRNEEVIHATRLSWAVSGRGFAYFIGGLQLVNTSDTLTGVEAQSVEGPWTWIDNTTWWEGDMWANNQPDNNINDGFGQHFLLQSHGGNWVDTMSCTGSGAEALQPGMLLLPVDWKKNPLCIAKSAEFFEKLDD